MLPEVDGQTISLVLSCRSKRGVVGRAPQPGVGGSVPHLAPLLFTDVLNRICEFSKPGKVPLAGFWPSGQPPAVIPSPALPVTMLLRMTLPLALASAP